MQSCIEKKTICRHIHDSSIHIIFSELIKANHQFAESLREERRISQIELNMDEHCFREITQNFSCVE